MRIDTFGRVGEEEEAASADTTASLPCSEPKGGLMAGAEKKSIETPDETRPFDKGRADMVTVGDVVFAKATFEPGWRWSECVKPIAGTDSCQVHHNGYVVSGEMHIVMDDGTELDIGPGDVFVCPAGHDAWVTSDEPCVAFDFSPGVVAYAKPTT